MALSDDVAAVKALAVRSCIIDGELIACDANGLADFQLLCWRKRDGQMQPAKCLTKRVVCLALMGSKCQLKGWQS
jgi:ATP-dependent DNA ligase